MALVPELLQRCSGGQGLVHAVQVVSIVLQGAVVVIGGHRHSLVADVVGVVSVVDGIGGREVAFIESDAVVASHGLHGALAAHAADHAHKVVPGRDAICKAQSTSCQAPSSDSNKDAGPLLCTLSDMGEL